MFWAKPVVVKLINKTTKKYFILKIDREKYKANI